jgi:RIO-like serine/threonine protein kinase
VQLKDLLKKNFITVCDGKKEILKVVRSPFKSFAIICCRHEAACLLKFAELGFTNAPKLICSSDNSFTMEKIEGNSLRDSGIIDEQLFFRIMDVVRELHGFGFAHGNLRPNNILIVDGSKPVLIDFETCCQIHNPLFHILRIYDYVMLNLLWQTRVMHSNPELVKTKFPGYVSLAMFIIMPIGRFRGIFKFAKKSVRRYLKVSAGKRV